MITVVYNDLEGLQRTLASVVRSLPTDANFEVVVVNGSTQSAIHDWMQQQEPNSWPFLKIVSEPDDGLYDAMNKGLSRARGARILFLNAGDELHPQLDVDRVLASSLQNNHVVLGYSVEAYGSDRYLRPGRGREVSAFRAPAHQATIYPGKIATMQFDVKSVVNADAKFTQEAIERFGALFLDEVVCLFELGGRSSSYGSTRLVRRRLVEVAWKGRLQLVGKWILWRLLPRRLFYRLLAWRKYDSLGHETVVRPEPTGTVLAGPIQMSSLSSSEVHQSL